MNIKNKSILVFFKSEIERDKKIGHPSYYLIYRPISFLFTTLFIFLNIRANQVTFFRLIFLFFTYAYCTRVETNYFSVIFINLLFVKILDFSDGSLSRYFNQVSTKGKLFENLVDYLSYLYPMTIYLYYLRVNNYFYNSEIDFLITLFLIFSYYFPIYLNNRILFLRETFLNNPKTAYQNNDEKNNKNIRKAYEIIHSLTLMFIYVLFNFQLFQYALIYLFLLRLFPFLNALNIYRKF